MCQCWIHSSGYSKLLIVKDPSIPTASETIEAIQEHYNRLASLVVNNEGVQFSVLSVNSLAVNMMGNLPLPLANPLIPQKPALPKQSPSTHLLFLRPLCVFPFLCCQNWKTFFLLCKQLPRVVVAKIEKLLVLDIFLLTKLSCHCCWNSRTLVNRPSLNTRTFHEDIKMVPFVLWPVEITWSAKAVQN